VITLRSPAPLAAVLALYADDPIASSLAKFAPNPRALAVAHVAGGLSWLAEGPQGRPVAAGGLIPHRGVHEAWLVCGRGCSAHMLAIVRQAQLTWRALAQDGPIVIRAHIGAEWPPGQRLARLLGMTKRGRELGMDVWEAAL
jgi:hypothetical protein